MSRPITRAFTNNANGRSRSHSQGRRRSTRRTASTYRTAPTRQDNSTDHTGDAETYLPSRLDPPLAQGQIHSQSATNHQITNPKDDTKSAHAQDLAGTHNPLADEGNNSEDELRLNISESDSDSDGDHYPLTDNHNHRDQSHTETEHRVENYITCKSSNIGWASNIFDFQDDEQGTVMEDRKTAGTLNTEQERTPVNKLVSYDVESPLSASPSSTTRDETEATLSSSPNTSEEERIEDELSYELSEDELTQDDPTPVVTPTTQDEPTPVATLMTQDDPTPVVTPATPPARPNCITTDPADRISPAPLMDEVDTEQEGSPPPSPTPPTTPPRCINSPGGATEITTVVQVHRHMEAPPGGNNGWAQHRRDYTPLAEAPQPDERIEAADQDSMEERVSHTATSSYSAVLRAPAPEATARYSAAHRPPASAAKGRDNKKGGKRRPAFRMTHLGGHRSHHQAMLALEKRHPNIRVRADMQPGGVLVVFPLDGSSEAQLRYLGTPSGSLPTFCQITPQEKPSRGVIRAYPARRRVDDIRNHPCIVKATGLRTVQSNVRMVLITHAGPLPRLLHLPAGGTYTVREAGPEPVRCYRCNAYGHTQARCRGSTTCGVCSGKHNTRKCIEKHRNGERTVAKCVNCRNAHHAWFPGCPARLEELANYRHDRRSSHGKRQPKRNNQTSEHTAQEGRNIPTHQHLQQEEHRLELTSHTGVHGQQLASEASSAEEDRDRNSPVHHRSQRELRTVGSTKRGEKRKQRLTSQVNTVETATCSVGKSKRKENRQKTSNQKPRQKESDRRKPTHKPQEEEDCNRSSGQVGEEQAGVSDPDLERFAAELSGPDLIRFANKMAQPIMKYCNQEKPKGPLEQLLHYILDGLDALNNAGMAVAEVQYKRHQRTSANNNTAKEPLATDNRPPSESTQHVADQHQH